MILCCISYFMGYFAVARNVVCLTTSEICTIVTNFANLGPIEHRIYQISCCTTSIILCINTLELYIFVQFHQTQKPCHHYNHMHNYYLVIHNQLQVCILTCYPIPSTPYAKTTNKLHNPLYSYVITHN